MDVIPLSKVFWCVSHVIPFDIDVQRLTTTEILQKLVWYLNKVLGDEQKIVAQLQLNAEQIAALQKDLATLQKTYDDFLAGKVPQSYIEGISKWLDHNLQCVVNRTVKFFSFGIDENGHVYCDMPYTWRWLEITWDMAYGTENFGHIELNW